MTFGIGIIKEYFKYKKVNYLSLKQNQISWKTEWQFFLLSHLPTDSAPSLIFLVTWCFRDWQRLENHVYRIKNLRVIDKHSFIISN